MLNATKVIRIQCWWHHPFTRIPLLLQSFLRGWDLSRTLQTTQHTWTLLLPLNMNGIQVGGMALTILSAWIAFVAWRERRRWLLIWSGIYGAVAISMTMLTYVKVLPCLCSRQIQLDILKCMLLHRTASSITPGRVNLWVLKRSP